MQHCFEVQISESFKIHFMIKLNMNILEQGFESSSWQSLEHPEFHPSMQMRHHNQIYTPLVQSNLLDEKTPKKEFFLDFPLFGSL